MSKCRVTRFWTIRAVWAALVAALALVWAPGVRAEESRTDVLFLKAMPGERAAALYERVLGKARGTSIVVGRDGQTLVVHDTEGRLARFRALLAILDAPGQGTAHVYARPVGHRTPSELAEKIRELVEPAKGAVLRLAPDDRASVLVVMTSPTIYERVDHLLRRLDVQRPRRQGRDRAIRVLPEP